MARSSGKRNKRFPPPLEGEKVIRVDDGKRVRAEISRTQNAFHALPGLFSAPGFQVKGARAPLRGFTLELKTRPERLAGMDCKAGLGIPLPLMGREDRAAVRVG
jgi:hypothetical protein